MAKRLRDIGKTRRLNPFTLNFSSPEIEMEFREDYFSTSLAYLRISFLFGIVFYAVFALLDFKVVTNYLPFWFIRFSIIIPVILIVLLLSYTRNFHRYWQQAIATSILISGFGIILMIYWADFPADRTYHFGLSLVLIYGYVLIKLRFIYNVACNVILTPTCIIMMHNSSLPSKLTFTNSFFFLTINLTVMIGGYFIEFYIRQEYYNRHLLKLERAKIEKYNRNLERVVLDRTRELKQKVTVLSDTKEALHDSEQLLKRAFDATNSAIWSLRFPELQFQFREVFNKLLHFEKKTAYQNFSYDLVHDEDRKDFICEITHIMQGKSNTVDFEYRLQNAAGNWLWVHSWGKVADFDSEGKPLRMVGTTVDINNRKLTELELEEIRKNLKESVENRTASLMESQRALVFLMEDMETTSQKLESVNQLLESVNKELESFSYSVSHDLKAPLRAINGFAAALKEDYFDLLGDDGRDFINRIETNATKMGTLINDLLEFSRLGRKQMNLCETDMGALFQKIFNELKYEIPYRDIFFHINSLPVLYADENLLRQVIVNLLSNAIKFTSTRDKAIIRITYQFVDKEHIFSVKDNGVGFDMAYSNKLFGVFQRLHSAEEFEGYGVGLSLVKRIITRHKGRIWAEAEPDKGATFHFSLPERKKD